MCYSTFSLRNVFRKPFNIKKTWSRSKPSLVQSGETFEIDATSSEAQFRSPSPPKDQSPYHQQSNNEPFAKNTDSSSSKQKTPVSRELKGILDNMPSLRRSPLPARRRSASVPEASQQQASGSKKITPKVTPKDKTNNTGTVEKPKQKLYTVQTV